MINDTALQIANNFSIVVAAPPGFIATTNAIDWSNVRDMGTGHPINAVVTIKAVVTTGGGLGALRFSLKLSRDSDVATPVAPANHFLHPTVGQSGVYTQSSLLIGTQISIALSPLTAVQSIPPVDPSSLDVRANQFLYGFVECFSVLDGTTATSILTGTIDWDFVLHAHTGSFSSGAVIAAQQKIYGPGFAVT